MSAVIVQIAEAVKDSLNDASFSQAFTAERAYVPIFELHHMDTLHVTVVPAGVVIAAADRSRLRRDCEIHIGVQKRLTDDEQSEIDGLMDLVQEIVAHFGNNRKIETPPAVCSKIENAPIYSAEHMTEQGQFTSLIRLTFGCVS